MQYHADSKNVTIAGRKYYWHNNKKKINSDADVKNNNMTKRVELVKPGYEFRFSIFFDKITEEELKKLLFVLNLGENNFESNHCHKIGYGKPIGLGSAKIIVESICTRQFKDGIYTESTLDDYVSKDFSQAFENQVTVKNILKVTDFNAVNGNDISYPKTKDSEDIFKWFGGNRKVLKSFGEPMKYFNRLPRLTDEEQYLPLDIKGGNSSYSGKPKNSGIKGGSYTSSSNNFSTSGGIKMKKKK